MKKTIAIICIFGIKALFSVSLLFLFINFGFSQIAMPPDITKHPTASSINAKSAALMLYVQALPRDEGKLTYQWYMSTIPSTNNFPIPLSEANITTIKNSPLLISGQTNYTLNTPTPNTAGTYYYWCVITNTNGAVTATSESNISKITVVDRTMNDELKNGDFERWKSMWADKYSTWNTTTVSNPANATAAGGTQARDKDPAVEPFNTFGKRWGTTSGNPITAGGFYATDAKSNPENYWFTTHYDNWANANNSANTNAVNINNNIYGIGPIEVATPTTLKSGLATAGHGIYVAELSADVPSSIYQDIATKPGKIYEWSLEVAARKVANEGISLTIGPSINVEADYRDGVTKRWFSAPNVPAAKVAERAYRYGYDKGEPASGTFPMPTYFNDILRKTADNIGVGQLTMKDQAGKSFATQYNGQTYYVAIANAPALDNKWYFYSGVYSVPEGQGTTVFAFSYIPSNTTANASEGNLLDNVVFKSGSNITPISAMFYSGKVSLSAKTKTGYVYGITEVRGSSVTDFNLDVKFCTVADCIGGDTAKAYDKNGSNGISHWYYPKVDTANVAGTITFEDLIPGKTYRIIGIPSGAVSGTNQLNTNKSPAEVLDDGYYSEITIPAAWEGNDTQMATATASAVSETEATIFVTNTNERAEYALVDYELSPAHENYVVFPWTTGLGLELGSPLVFDGLQPNHCYVIAARPLGYTEITYQEAAVLSPAGSGVLIRTPAGGASVLQDILKTDITRVHNGLKDKITLKNTDSRGEYGIYDPATGYFIALDGTLNGQKFHPGGAGNGDIVFMNLDPAKIYHLTVRERNISSGSLCSDRSTFMVGVRVYPYSKPLSIDYIEERVQDNSNSPKFYIPKEIEYRMKALNSPEYTWLIGNGQNIDHENANTWYPATGTTYLMLGLKQNNGVSLLDLMKALNADTALLYSRLHPIDVDGWIGPSVQPESDPLIIPRRPDAPVKNTLCDLNNDYILLYNDLPERIQLHDADSIAYSLNNGETWILVKKPNTIDLANDLEWSVAKKTVLLRLPAIPNLSFASEITVDTLLGRKHAPSDPYSEIYDNAGFLVIKIVGLDADTKYQYKKVSENIWHNFTGANAIYNLDFDGTDYEIRFAPACEEPASLSQILSVPLSVVSVDFGSIPYGYTLNNLTKSIIVRNVANIDVLFDSIKLTGENSNLFTIHASLNNLVPKMEDSIGQNKEYSIVPIEGLSAGTYHTTILLTYNNGTAIATADAYLTVEKVKWQNTMNAEYTNPTDTSFHLNITNPPNDENLLLHNNNNRNGTIQYSINTSFDKQGMPGGDISTDFTKFLNALSPATAYTIYYRVKEDSNHYASDIKSLTAYTAYAKECNITYIDYEQEMLFMAIGKLSSNYEIAVIDYQGNKKIVNMPYQVSVEADNGFTVSVRRIGPDTNIPVSDTCNYIVDQRPNAPTGITVLGNNKINLAGNFQYRRAGNTNIMANWQAAINETGVISWGGYEVRRPASNTENKFASKYTTLFLAPVLTCQTSLYVDIARMDGVGTGNASSWQNATPSLSAALEFAKSCSVDTIFVATGTYKPDYAFDGSTDDSRKNSFNLPSNVVIMGGYAGYNSTVGQMGKPNTGNQSSILSGDLGISGENSDNSYHVVYANNAVNTTLKGFVIENGNADGTSEMQNGAGIYITGVTSLKFINLDIHFNKAANNGGGIFIATGTTNTSITNVTISGNIAKNGGGIYQSDGTMTVNNTIVYDNNADNYPEIAEAGGSRVYGYSLIKGTNPIGAGNLNSTANPLFVNANAKNYRLQTLSPCRDAGNDANYQTVVGGTFNRNNEADVVGKARFSGTAIDMGAYETQIPTISGTAIICSGDTLQLSQNGTPNGTWASSDPTIAVVNNSGKVISDVVLAGSIYVIRDDNHDAENEGKGGNVDISYTTPDGYTGTTTITVIPRIKKPTLAYNYDNICSIDESEKNLLIDMDVINIENFDTLVEKHLKGYIDYGHLIDTIDAGTKVRYPSILSQNNVFYNRVYLDSMILTFDGQSVPAAKIKWYASENTNIEMTTVDFLASPTDNFIDPRDGRPYFWQNLKHDNVVYWASIIDNDSCASRRVEVNISISESPKAMNITPLITRVCKGSKLDLSEWVSLHGVALDWSQHLEWYRTLADATIAANNPILDTIIKKLGYNPTIAPDKLDLEAVCDSSFTIVRADNFGCRSMPSKFMIKVLDFPEVTLLVNNKTSDTICKGDSALITVVFTQGKPPFNITVSNPKTDEVVKTVSNIKNYSNSFYVKPTVLSYYVVSVLSDSNATILTLPDQCSFTTPYSKTDTVAVNELPIVSMTNGLEICAEDQAIALIFTGKPPFILDYTIDRRGAGTGLTPASLGLPTIFYENAYGITAWNNPSENIYIAQLNPGLPGIFTFNLLKITDGNGCKNSKD